MTVEAEEIITVPAETFKTLKLIYRNKKTGSIRYSDVEQSAEYLSRRLLLPTPQSPNTANEGVLPVSSP